MKPTAPPADGRAGPRRVAVTGLGPISAVGIGVAAFWDGLRRQRSGIRRITRFDAAPWRCRIAAEVDGFEPHSFMDAKTAKRLDRYSHFAIAAARLAIDDAGLETDRLDRDRVGVQIGSALGGIAFAEQQIYNRVERGIRGVDPRVATTTFCGAASCSIAIEFGLTGPNATNAMSCASGAIALGDGMRLIRDGSADIVLAGGVEAPLAPVCFGAFSLIRAMSTRNDDPQGACRPFDRDRDGFVMGEGACVVILEEWTRATARGARIYAELAGYGTTADAYHMTAPRPDADQAARAVRLALDSAAIEPRDVAYVNAHGSSTPLNDTTETRAIKKVLGDRGGDILSGARTRMDSAYAQPGATR